MLGPNAQALLPAKRVSSSGLFGILTLNVTFYSRTFYSRPDRPRHSERNRRSV